MGLNPIQLQYVEVFCEALLYGVYSVLILAVLYIFLSGRKICTSHRVVFGVSTLMFALATIHMALVLSQAMSTTLLFDNLRTRMAIAVVMFGLGDSVLIWRVWGVWAHNLYVIGLPLVVHIISIAFGAHACATVTPHNLFSVFALPSVILTMILSIMCTGLIVGRLWYLQYQISQATGESHSFYTSGSPYKGIMLLLCESGAIYTAVQIVSLVLDVTGNVGVHVVNDINIPLVGILPTLLILLVHFELVPGSHANKRYNETMRSRFAVAAPPSSGSSEATKVRSTQSSIPLRLFEVQSGDDMGGNNWKMQDESVSSMRFADAVAPQHVV